MLSTELRRIIGGGCLVVLACGLTIGRAHPAAADPGGCFVDRGLTDAVALCHEGYGSAVLEVECLGISVPPTPDAPIFGPYSGTDSAPTAVGEPMRASCWTSTALGITTRAFVSSR
ncbi:hypothetical protein ABZ942_17550 [Nocardia sp. NPDC046473]|uniref:hypothetical protein n=1 Tax=Nocardia sp. NPDC046473 TaxID=3155733 RepID=UPI0033EAF3AE